MGAAPSSAWGSSVPHAGFPLPPSLNPCNTNSSWHLVMSSIWQRRSLNPTPPSSALPAISSCDCIPSADATAQKSSSCLVRQPHVFLPCQCRGRTLASAVGDCQHMTGEVIAGDSHVTLLITHMPVQYRLSLNSLKTISDPSLCLGIFFFNRVNAPAVKIPALGCREPAVLGNCCSRWLAVCFPPALELRWAWWVALCAAGRWQSPALPAGSNDEVWQPRRAASDPLPNISLSASHGLSRLQPPEVGED